MGVLRPWTIVNKSGFVDNRVEYTDTNGLAMFLVGREFERWIDTDGGSSRSNGFNEGDAIKNPAYVIESILRDEVFTERKLRVDETDDATSFTLDGSNYDMPLRSSEDGYYNFAIFHNLSTGHKSYITDYDGATKTVTLASTDISGAATKGNFVFISNIQGHNRIDTASFDAVGNTTNGSRKDYEAAASIKNVTNAFDVIDEICRNFLLMLTNNAGKYKLFTVEKKATADATWTNPLKDLRTGTPMVSGYLSPLQNVYSKFNFRHSFNYHKNDFTRVMNCDRSGDNGGLGATYTTLCAAAETNYRIASRTMEAEFPFINDGLPNTSSTMKEMAKKYITFYTKRRWFVDWAGDFKNYCAYEVGDQIKLNYPGHIPSALNNSAFFVITAKNYDSVNGVPFIRFSLMETE